MESSRLDLFPEDSKPQTRVRGVSLSDFTALISGAIAQTKSLQKIWVIAELSDVRLNGGHCYMELIEKDKNGKTVAKLRAAVWANVFKGIRQKFFQATGRDITNGIKVMVCGSANHHSLYGLSFIINDIDPTFTLGDRERIRREILTTLYNEGVLENNKKISLCPNPQRIAVVSAPGAAGFEDFINQLNNNSNGFVFYPKLFPALMQGEKTVETVLKSLDEILKTKELWDCVVIIRGGGSTSDLEWFDNIDLARKIATFPIPVAVGIGHERDRTVLDEIAHTRVKTPTAAAAFFIQTLEETFSRTFEAVDFILRYSSNRIAGEKIRLSHLSVSVPSIIKGRLDKEKLRLESKIPVIESNRQRIVSLSKSKEERILEKINQYSGKRIEKEKQNILRLEDLVAVLNPLNTLQRGYAIVRKDNKAVQSYQDVEKGNKLNIQIKDGNINVEVR